MGTAAPSRLQVLHDHLKPRRCRGGAASRGQHHHRCFLPWAEVPGRLLSPNHLKVEGGEKQSNSSLMSLGLPVPHHYRCPSTNTSCCPRKVLHCRAKQALAPQDWSYSLLRKRTHTRSCTRQKRFIISLKKFRLQGQAGTLGLRRPRYCPYLCQRPAGESRKT